MNNTSNEQSNDTFSNENILNFAIWAQEHMESMLSTIRNGTANAIENLTAEGTVERSLKHIKETYIHIAAYMEHFNTQMYHPLNFKEVLEKIQTMDEDDAVSLCVDALFMYKSLYEVMLCIATMKEAQLQGVATELKKAQEEAEVDAELTEMIRVWLN